VPEPIIPSGRDYDAGLAPGRKGGKQGLLGRIASKIKKGRGSKVHDFDLRLESRVGAQQPPPRKGPQPAERTIATDAAEQKQPTPAQPKRQQHTAAVPARAKPTVTKAPVVPSLESLLEAQVPGGSLGISAWLLLANPDDCSALTVQYLEHMLSTRKDATLSTIVRWRLSDAAAGSKPASHSLTQDSSEAPDLPADIAEVLRFLAANPMSLAKYRGDVGLGAGKAAAFAQLRSFCRDYPSAEPILRALEAGDIATAHREIKYDSAAWHYGMSTINTAIAVVNGRTSAGDIPTCGIPREWFSATGTAEQRCAAAALSSIVADDERSRLRRRFEPEFTAAIASMPDEIRAQAAVWLSVRGIRLRAATQPPKRRQLRSPGTDSLAGAQQPSSARQHPRPAVAPNRCPRCGIGEPERPGGICSLCAHGGN
jgi:hypothetical protein